MLRFSEQVFIYLLVVVISSDKSLARPALIDLNPEKTLLSAHV